MNPFDQFDQGPAPVGNPFDAFDHEHAAPHEGRSLPLAQADEGNYRSSIQAPETASTMPPAVDDFGRPIGVTLPSHPERQWQAPWGQQVTLPYEPAPPPAPEDQSLTRARINSLRQGFEGAAAETIAGPARMVQGMGAAARNFARGQMGVIAKIDAGQPVSPEEDAAGYASMSPQQRASFKAQMGAAVGQAPGPTETAAGALADRIASGESLQAARNAPINPKYAHDPLVVGLRMAGGLPLLAAGAVLGGPLGAAGVAFSQGYESDFEAARQNGADANTAHGAAMLGGLTNAGLMAIPAAGWVGGLPKVLGGQVADAAARYAMHAGTMVGVSQAQQLAENLIAQRSYDPQRSLFAGLGENIPEQAAVGALFGAGFEGAARLMGPRDSAAAAARTPAMQKLDAIAHPQGEEQAPGAAPAGERPAGGINPDLPENYFPPAGAPEAPKPQESTPSPQAAASPVETPEAQAPPKPQAAPFVMLDPRQLIVDPERFQYKAADARGVTGALRGVARWEPALANPITAWQDNDGRLYVVNGHQRTDLALRAQAAGQPDVQMPARIYREADGITAQDARTLGAYQNIAEGSGTAQDAARVLRSPNAQGLTLPDLPPRSAMVRDARALAALSDSAFRMVTNGVVPESYAARVGEATQDPTLQMAALGVLAKVKPANVEQAAMVVRDVLDSPLANGGAAAQQSLFGDENIGRSLYAERAQILDRAQRVLGGNRAIFSAALRGEQPLADAGNQLSTEGNQRARANNDRLLKFLGTDALARGPLSDALSGASRELAAGKPLSAVVSGFLATARQLAAHTGEAPGTLRHGPASGGRGYPSEAGTIGEGFEAPKPPRNVPGQGDIFGPPKAAPERRAPEPTVKGDPRQLGIPGTEPSARQAQAARDAAGPRTDQKPADEGLFAPPREAPQPDLPLASPVERNAFESVPRFRDLLSTVPQSRDVPAHVTAANWVTERGRETGHEYLAIVDHRSGRIVHAGTSDEPGEVDFDPMAPQHMPEDSLTVHHNHPRNTALSNADIRMLAVAALRYVFAHGADGDTFGASLGDGIKAMRGSSAEAVSSLMRKLKIAHLVTMNRADRFLEPAVRAGRISDETRLALLPDVAARLLSAHGVIDYLSTQVLPAPVREALEGYLVDRGFAAGVIHRATYAARPGEGLARLHAQDQGQAGLQERPGFAEDDPASGVLPARPGTTGNPREGDATVYARDGLYRSPPTGRAGTGVAGLRARGPQPVGLEAGRQPGRSGQTPGVRSARPGGFREGPAPATPEQRPLLERVHGNLADLAHKTRDATASLFAPIATGTQRAQAHAVAFANALRGVQYQFKLVDDHLTRTYTPEQRAAMGTAMDRQSVFEQQLAQMPEAERQAQEPALRAAFDASGAGVAGLPEKARADVERLAALGQRVWQRMQDRNMVPPGAKGLPYYFGRQIVARDENGNYTRAGQQAGAGPGSDIYGLGRNLTTAGPGRREHLTAEETEAAAKAKLGANVSLIRDIRSVGQALSRQERAIAGSDFVDSIKRIGKETGVDLVVHGDIPGMLDPGAYFTMNHPAFRRWTGSGFQNVHIAKEFEGPIKAVLTQKPHALYSAAMRAKGLSMSAIMYSPFMHLSVEIGRAAPLLRGSILSTRFWRLGHVHSLDPGYMAQAVRDGLAPIGQSWRVDPATIADEADLNKAPPGALGRAADAWEHVHQRLLWDQVFKLQVGIYDTIRDQAMRKGFSQEVAGIMAAHAANRYAGSLPSENLARGVNMAANLLLFSRSFTLGNLGVIKDMTNGMPTQQRAAIAQLAGPEAARDARTFMRRKAIAAFTLDVGLSYLTTALTQQMIQVAQRTPQMGLGPAAQSVYEDWRDNAVHALGEAWDHGDPLALLGVLPQHYNEPGKRDRAYVGLDASGRGVYARLSLGKLGEEFLGWFSKPGTMVMNKLSPWTRPVIESIFGADSLGRPVEKPDPQTLGDYLDNAGRVAVHLVRDLGPTQAIEGAAELGREAIGQGTPSASPWVSAAKVFLPMTGLGQISSGYPGGPEAGAMAATKRGVSFDIAQALPGARRMIEAGDIDGAMDRLVTAGADPREAAHMIRTAQMSGTRPAMERWFARHATPEQVAALQHVTGARP